MTDRRDAIRTCPFCESTCGLTIQLSGEVVDRVSGDPSDVFSHGFMCPKGASLGEVNADPDWLRSPLVKVDGRFVEVDWETAFRRVAELFAPLRADPTRSAPVVATYIGNTAAHNLGGYLYSRLVPKALGSPYIYSSSTVDQRPKELASALMYGSHTSVAVPDIDRTDLIVLIGANPVESNGSLATAPGWPRRLQAVRDRGGQVVVIDPVRTRTVDLADWHIRPRAGTDAALLFSVVHALFELDLVDFGVVGPYLHGAEDVEAAAAAFPPERTAPYTGVSAQEVYRLARALARARSACVYGRMGTTVTEFGSIASWLIDVINIATGNLDRPGGVMFPTPAAGSANTQGARRFGKGMRTPRFRSRVRQAPEIFGELPVTCLPEEILEPGEARYQGMVVIGANPVVSAPNSTLMVEALEALQALVVVDPYINDTSRLADVILPPPPPLQRSHYDLFFYRMSVRNVANYSPPALEREVGRLDEWEILCGMAAALDGTGRSIEQVDEDLAVTMIQERQRDSHDTLHGRDVDEILASLEPRRGPERLLDLMLRSGPYGEWSDSEHRLSLASLEAQPHGVDLGPLQPRMPDVLRTPDGEIDLAPRLLMDDVPRLEESLNKPVDSRLRLIGRRQLRSNNSWLHNAPSLMTGKSRATLRLNPQDANDRGIDDGQWVVVSSNVASVRVMAEVSPRLPPGTCSLPHGWLHSPKDVRLAVARTRPGVNVNRITSTEAMDVPSWTAAVYGIPVDIAPLTAS